VVYIVRNPLAVVPSLASHYGISIDQAIAQLANEQFSIARPGARLRSQLHQPMGSWSQHVASWLTQSDMAVHTVRYEDLCADPLAQFRALLAAVGLPEDDNRLARALAQSRFEALQAAEAAQGFKERLAPAARFFRQGKAQAWRHELSAEQISRVVASHAHWMQRLGYDLKAY
jgi:plasmid stabilization system protein ParE